MDEVAKEQPCGVMTEVIVHAVLRITEPIANNSRQKRLFFVQRGERTFVA